MELRTESEHDPAAGYALPLRLRESGTVDAGRGDPLSDTLRLVLEVAPGERPLLPEFGCRVHLMETIADATARSIAAALIEECLERWAPWLHVERVDVIESSADGLRLALRVAGEEKEFRMRLRRGVTEVEKARLEA